MASLPQPLHSFDPILNCPLGYFLEHSMARNNAEYAHNICNHKGTVKYDNWILIFQLCYYH